MLNCGDVSAAAAARARIVLWRAEGRGRKDIGPMGGVSLPTVDRWVSRCEHGLTGLDERKPGGGRVLIDPRVRAGILALTQAARPSAHTGCRTGRVG